MRYFANFNANNGTSYREPIEGYNKKELLKKIRSIALGNRFQGSMCTWMVWDEKGELVFQGCYDGKKISYALYNYKFLY